MQALVDGVQNGPKSLKLGSYKAIEFICETVVCLQHETSHKQEPEHLAANSNAILNAVVQGTQATQRDDDIRIAAISTLYSGLSFVRDNMEREGERNFIMQVVCESTQHSNPRVQVPAYSCLVRIMQLYYEKMKFYMEKALFGLTVIGMRNPNLDVATQAVEFWSSVCEEELDITAEILEALEMGEQPERENYNFAKTALMEVLPQILQLLFRQDEDDDDDWTVANSAAAAITLFAQIAENAVLGPVLQFVETNIRSETWNAREAAVMAFGSVMDGPEPGTLQPLVSQAFPVLIGMLADPNAPVRESTSWALARATELIPKGFQPDTHLRPLMEGLVVSLRDTRSTTIQNCAWTIQNVCGIIGATKPTDPTTPLGPYYEALVTELMNVTTRYVLLDGTHLELIPSFKAVAMRVGRRFVNSPRDLAWIRSLLCRISPRSRLID
jgi:importin subunit beta-1